MSSPIEQYQAFFDRFGQPTKALIIGPEDVTTFAVEMRPEVPTIFVDGGARWREKLSRTNDESETISTTIGDGDSYDGTIDIKLPAEKDFSDFAFALKNLPSDICEIETHGFLGGDSAHEIINFGEAHHLLKKREHTFMTFNGTVWAFSPGEWSFYLNGRFSLVVVVKCELSLEGLCEYQIKQKQYIEPLSSLGLGNSAIGKVTVNSSGPFFIFGEKPLTLA